jgi:hypothetical protein
MKLTGLIRLARKFAASEGIDADEAKVLLTKGAQDVGALRADEAWRLRQLEHRFEAHFTREGYDTFHDAVLFGSHYDRVGRLERIGELDRVAPNGGRVGLRQAVELITRLVADPERPLARELDVVSQIDMNFLHRFTPRGKREWTRRVMDLYQKAWPEEARR